MRDIRTTVRGNVTGDVTSTTHDDGNVTAKLRIAVNSRYYVGETGEYVDRKTEFINVYARRSLAKNVLDSVRKGQPLIVTGRISSQEWQDHNGQSHFSLSIAADSIGHDLSYGTTVFSKTPKGVPEHDVDFDTGEIKTSHFSATGAEQQEEPVYPNLDSQAARETELVAS